MMAESSRALHRAAESGNYDDVCSLIEKKLEINETDEDGFTPLHKAAQSGHENVVEILIKNGANIEVTEESDLLYPIHLAVKHGHIQVVKVLIKYGANVNSRSEFSLTPIHFAAQEGRVDIITYLLENGVDVEIGTERKGTPLHMAAGGGHAEAVECLIQNKANVNTKDDVQCTALHYAAMHGRVDVSTVLIKNGAKINEKNYFGRTPLFIACSNGHTDVVKVLEEVGAVCKLTGCVKRYSALHAAAKEGQMQIIQYFFEKGANVDFQTKNGYTLLHAAAKYGHKDLVNFLLDRGADINAKTHPQKYNPLYFAARYSYANIIELLIQNGADFKVDDGLFLFSLICKKFSHDEPESEQEEYRENAEIIIKYLLLRDQTVQIDLSGDYSFFTKLGSFRNNCLKEIKKMELYVFKNSIISLCTFLSDMFILSKLVNLLRNECIRQELEILTNYLSEYTIYRNIDVLIKTKMRTGYERLQLLDKADLVMKKIKPILPIECRRKLLNFLNCWDLKNLIRSNDKFGCK